MELKKSAFAFWTILAVAGLLTACSRGATTAPAAASATAQTMAPSGTQDAASAESAEPVYTAPLTGQAVDRPIDSRPYLVMINNHAKARPQSGLSRADQFYEVLAEGEITRILAVFQSRPVEGAIGPVRSIRPYFIDIGKSLDAIFVHAGGSPDGYAMLSNEKLDHLDEITNAGPYFWRDKSRKAPHNLYTNLDKIAQGVAKKKFHVAEPLLRTYPFLKPDAPAQGEDAPSFDLTFLLKSYKVTYRYDPERQVYLRFINGEPHLDLNNREQLSAANVVVLEAPHRILDDEGRRAVDLSAGGKAVLFQRGKMRQAEWKRARTDDVIRLYEGGEELGLYPGQTHFLIIPDRPGIGERLHVGEEAPQRNSP